MPPIIEQIAVKASTLAAAQAHTIPNPNNGRAKRR
jgi:hypothetical protein